MYQCMPYTDSLFPSAPTVSVVRNNRLAKISNAIPGWPVQRFCRWVCQKNRRVLLWISDNSFLNPCIRQIAMGWETLRRKSFRRTFGLRTSTHKYIHTEQGLDRIPSDQSDYRQCSVRVSHPIAICRKWFSSKWFTVLADCKTFYVFSVSLLWFYFPLSLVLI
jgi:hypothetical protein